MAKTLTGEASVKRAICDLLAAKRILYWRMNAGMTVLTDGCGKRRMIAGHGAGTADILAAPMVLDPYHGQDYAMPRFFWIECKRPKCGIQSPAQKEFQARVEAEDHQYIIATSVDDVINALRELGI